MPRLLAILDTSCRTSCSGSNRKCRYEIDLLWCSVKHWRLCIWKATGILYNYKLTINPIQQRVVTAQPTNHFNFAVVRQQLWRRNIDTSRCRSSVGRIRCVSIASRRHVLRREFHWVYGSCSGRGQLWHTGQRIMGVGQNQWRIAGEQFKRKSCYNYGRSIRANV